jgi:hypothetical protein
MIRFAVEIMVLALILVLTNAYCVTPGRVVPAEETSAKSSPFTPSEAEKNEMKGETALCANVLSTA